MAANKPSTAEIIIKGYLLANIPTALIILVVWFGLWKILNINYLICVCIGTAVGWYYWAFSIKKWIKWAKSSGVEDKHILKIGRLSLLLWNKSTIDGALKNENK